MRLKSCAFFLSLVTVILFAYSSNHEQRVIEWIPRRFTGGAAMMTYEQIRPDDAFGRTMVANLESRGCPLLGLRGHPTLDSQRLRFESRGWTRARALDMNDIYRFVLPADDVRRIERLELWDEFEEWNMIQAHYCIALAQLDARPLAAAAEADASSSASSSSTSSSSEASSSSSSSSSFSSSISSLTDAQRQAIAATPLSQISFLLIDTEAAKQRVMKFMD
jgi:tRNA wybutosine-synthesizing protein 4